MPDVVAQSPGMVGGMSTEIDDGKRSADRLEMRGHRPLGKAPIMRLNGRDDGPMLLQ